ncbi:MAG: transposase [Dehalococcoidia bacterium]|jgi:hypothetical protein|nr:transposase [Dehalococcoidia bacterium]
MQTKSSTTKKINNLSEFRQTIYTYGLTGERDAQFELVDSLLLSPTIASFPALSQSPVFRRGWPSAYTAMERGGQDKEWMRGYLSQQVPGTGVRVFALDTSVWPRPRSRTLQGLRYERSPTQAVQGHSTVKGHAYSTLAWIPQRGESWMLPVDSRRLVGKETAVAAGVEQVNLLHQHRSPAGVNVVVGDGSYGNHRFLGAVKDLSCVVVVRLRRDRVLYGVPGPYPGKGRPAVHGRRFAFKEAETWGMPDEDVRFSDDRYGQVRLRSWHRLHAKQDAYTPFSVILAEVHLERERPPKPIWLAHLGTDAYSARDLWLWFDHRGSIEPGFRFRKQRLAWILPHFQQAERSDRWTTLVDLACWQLFLARDLVQDQPLPWQKPQTELTPGRVLQSLGGLFAQIETPASPPQTRGKSPGWPQGRSRTRPQRYPVVKRGKKAA